MRTQDESTGVSAGFGAGILAAVVAARARQFPLFGAAMLVAAIVLGGGTRSGFLSDFILQLTALPLLLLAIWRCLHLPSGGPTRYALLACGLIALVPLRN